MSRSTFQQFSFIPKLAVLWIALLVLPFAERTSRLTKVTIRPAKIDAARIVARLKNAKAPGGICWDGFSQNIEKMMLTPFWKATAARPPNSP